MKKHFLLLSIILLLLSGCSSSSSAYYYIFPEGGWDRFNNPEIEFDVMHPGIYYDIWLEIHFDPAQEPDKFPLTTIMYTPSGEMRSRNVVLDPNSENTKDGVYRIMLRQDYAFTEKGICKFEFENRSARMKAPGILKIGVIIEKQ